MELKFIFEEENEETAVKYARSLGRWIEDEELDGVTTALQRKELAPDEAGGVTEGVLAVVMTAPLMIPLVKTLHIWLQERTKQKAKSLNIKIKIGKKEIEIDTQNEALSEESLLKLITKTLK